MNRYSAKLLFQFRVEDGTVKSTRLCEERIVSFPAESTELALTKAKNRGGESTHSYRNDDGHTVFFEFVGVLDLLQLGLESDAEDVWYEIIEKDLPLEVPAESELTKPR